MTYKKSDFGNALFGELKKGFDVDRISHWAFEQRANHIGELEAGLDDSIMTVVAMGEGPEFHLSEKELRKLAAELLEA